MLASEARWTDRRLCDSFSCPVIACRHSEQRFENFAKAKRADGESRSSTKAPRSKTPAKRASIPCTNCARVRPFAKATRRSHEEINSPAIGGGAIGNTSGINGMWPCIAPLVGRASASTIRNGYQGFHGQILRVHLQVDMLVSVSMAYLRSAATLKPRCSKEYSSLASSALTMLSSDCGPTCCGGLNV